MFSLFHLLIISVFVQLAFFVFALIKQTDKVTDLAYGVGFVSLAGIVLFNSSGQWYHLALFVMILAWAVRLSTYLLIRIFVMGRDKRFDGIREYSQKFIKFFLFQGLAVWLILLSTFEVLSTSGNNQITMFSMLGISIYLVGLISETMADYQKFMFKRDPKNDNQWIDTGLWKYARHPNYFGEMLVWWGIFVFSLAIVETRWWVSIISPLTITSILLFFSGIPPLEKRYNEKYKGNKKYEAYKRNTRLLAPFPKFN